MTKTLSVDQLRRRLAKAKCEKYDLLKKRRLEIKQFDPEIITVPDRLRALNQSKVDELAESMDAIGQQQPITVWLDDPDDAAQTLYLVAGAHRLAAAIKLGWDEINVILTEDMTEIDRQLWEIDENLMRAELSPTERGEHITRRAEIWNAIPEVGGATCATHDASGRKKTPQQERGFAAETAAATGLSKATINRDLARTEGIIQELRDQIKGTHLDKGTYLDSIKGMELDAQREQVMADLEAPAKPKIPGDIRAIMKGTHLDRRAYRDSLKGMEPAEQRARVIRDLEGAQKPKLTVVIDTGDDDPRFETLKRDWSAAPAETRRRFKAWIQDK